jgi:ribosomal protein S12 methylthiotransferase accessory factor YcaO
MVTHRRPIHRLAIHRLGILVSKLLGEHGKLRYNVAEAHSNQVGVRLFVAIVRVTYSFGAKDVGVGKGPSPDDAKVDAAMDALQRLSDLYADDIVRHDIIF